MKVNYIKTIGFRKFRRLFETNLYDITSVTGKNRSGKSNLLYAIINIFLGTNLSGDEKACLINNKCDASYGEIHFTDNNNIEHILIRGKHKYDNSKNFISLDGNIVKQEDLIDFYRDKKLFLSILNPMYFLNKKPGEQKELVDKYLSSIKPFTIFNKLSKETQNALLSKYCDKKANYDELSSEGKENFINQNLLNICMDIAFSNLSKKEQKLLEGMPKNIQDFILETNNNIKRIENLNATLQGKIDYAQNIVDEKLPSYKTFEKDEELNLARQELNLLTSNQTIIDKEKQQKLITKISEELLSKENELEATKKLMEETKKQYYEIKNSNTAKCPTCNHILDNNKTVALLNMKKLAMQYYDKNVDLSAQIEKLKMGLTVEKAKFYSLDANANVNNSEKIRIVEQNIKCLENEKSEIDKYNSIIDVKIKNIESAKKDISNFNKAKNTNSQMIDNLKETKKVAQKLYINYIEQKMCLAKDYLKNVNIKFYSVLKTTGEIKEDFIITYQNKPLSDLSRSETIATALEFANMFNQISKSNFPLFIDDYESCADYDFIKEYAKNTQVIVSKVEKGNLLKIADYNNTDNYVVIKPIITGARTIFINNTNLQKNKKVA